VSYLTKEDIKIAVEIVWDICKWLWRGGNPMEPFEYLEGEIWCDGELIMHVWVCKGCLIGAGLDPDKVSESCIGRSGPITCAGCDHIQDATWFRHVRSIDLPQSLQDKLK
jgi:hypothetical protein